MANEQNKGRGTWIFLGMVLVVGLVAVGVLLAALSSHELVEGGLHVYGVVATHLWSPFSAPLAVFYLLLLGTLGLVFLFGRCLYRKFFGKSEVWRQYRIDTFFWVEWQWDYSWKGKVINLWCECDKCAEVMKPKVVPDGDSGLGVRFICNLCGKQSTTIRSAESEREALDRVEKKIARKIRVGKYRGEIDGRVLDGGNKGCF